MKRLATALVAAGALLALSGCVADPYYGNSYYGGGFYGSPYGGSGSGYYRYERPYSYGRSYGYGGYNRPYRGRPYDRRYEVDPVGGTTGAGFLVGSSAGPFS